MQSILIEKKERSDTTYLQSPRFLSRVKTPRFSLVETTFFPATYHRFCHMIDRRRPYLLTGKVEEDWGAITMMVNQVARIAG
jgi:hypothetical protein